MIYRYMNSNNRIINVVCNNDIDVGDVVTVNDYGKVYSSYLKAFEYFKIPRRKIHIDYLNPYERSWVVIDIAVHNFGDVVLLCLINAYREYLVINVEGVSKRNNSRYENKLDSKKNKILDKIER